ncbi:hypothetical protein AKJ16_DCAP15057 [Drosera capensis]
MADSVKQSDEIQELLKPFRQRAAEAEDRLSRLEAALTNKQDGHSEESGKLVKDLQLKLEEMSAELALERSKVAKRTIEGQKKDYRINHLIRSLHEADKKIEELKTK